MLFAELTVPSEHLLDYRLRVPSLGVPTLQGGPASLAAKGVIGAETGTSLVPPFGGPECSVDITLLAFGLLSEGALLLVVIPLRSCISSGLGGPTRSQ